jgi:hypothetical protein
MWPWPHVLLASLFLLACGGVLAIVSWVIFAKTGGRVQLRLLQSGTCHAFLFANWQTEWVSAREQEHLFAGIALSIRDVSVPRQLLDTLRIPGSFTGCTVSCISVHVSLLSRLSGVPAVQVHILQPAVSVELSSQPHTNGGISSTPQHVSPHLLADVQKILCPPCMLARWWTSTSEALRARLAPYMLLLLNHVALHVERANFSASAPKCVNRQGSGESQHERVEILCHVGCVAIQPAASKRHGGADSCRGLSTLIELSGVGVACEVATGGFKQSGKLLQQWRVGLLTQVQMSWPQRKEWYLCCSSDVDMKALTFHCNGAIFEALNHVSSLLLRHNQQLQYLRYRPCVPVSQNPQAWWKYAGRSVLSFVCSLRNEPKWPVHLLCKLPAFVTWQKQGRSKGADSEYPNSEHRNAIQTCQKAIIYSL